MQRLGGQTDTVDCMAWLKKSSNGPVTVAFLEEHRVPLSWQEGVAIVLEIAELFQRSGKRAAPRDENVALTPSGTVEFLRGRTQSGDAVSALARTLNTLLPPARPTQLRLLVSTAGSHSGAYKSTGEFIEALKYFERPGRRNLLSEIHQRAIADPVASVDDGVESPGTAPTKKRETRRRSRFLVPAVVVLLLVAVAGGSSLMDRVQTGAILDQTQPLQSVASDAWSTALAATAEFRKSASRDLSLVLDKMRDATGDLMGEMDGGAADGEPSEAASSPSESRRAVPSPGSEPAFDGARVEPTVFQSGGGVVEADPSTITVAAAVELTESDAVSDPLASLVSTELFDSNDVDVTPPVTVRLQAPPVADRAGWREDVGVVEAIVSARGTVETVKLISPPESVHQAMILSAIKTWRFRPAERDGVPVRYRQMISVAIPK